jgi:hypothetical protein
VVVSGPALYLLAHVAMRLRMAGTVSWRRLGGAVACLAVGLVGLAVPALVVAALLVAVLVGVITVERVAEARREARRRRSSGSRPRPACPRGSPDDPFGVVRVRADVQAAVVGSSAVRFDPAGAASSSCV